MYSERLRELFHRRAHAGRLESATHYGEAGTPGQGPYVRLWLRGDAGVVRAARYQTYGCPAVIACSEALCEALEGRPFADAAGVTPEQLAARVGGVPEGKEHCPQLAASAGRTARAQPCT